MISEEIKQYINKVLMNIAYCKQDYLKQQISNNKCVYIEDIPSIVEKAIHKTQCEEMHVKRY